MNNCINCIWYNDNDRRCTYNANKIITVTENSSCNNFTKMLEQYVVNS